VATTAAGYGRRHALARVGVYLAAFTAALICAGPFLWSLVTAFKQNRDLYNPENNPFFFNLAATTSRDRDRKSRLGGTR
jgi:multiple sugar transport system permease protein